MIANTSATLAPKVTTSGRKLLIGRSTSEIPMGSLVVLVRDGDAYRLVTVTTDTRDQNDPSTLGSFLDPDIVDAIENSHALALAIEATKPKRKSKAKRPKATT